MILIVLGNRLNDDGSMTDCLRERLELTRYAIERLKPRKVILSGGVANKASGIPESKAMKDYLLACGTEEGLLKEESKSLTTRQNALFSVPIAAAMGAKKIVVLSDRKHILRWYLNPVRLFRRAIGKQDIACCGVFDRAGVDRLGSVRG